MAGTGIERSRCRPGHPSLLFHDLVKRLGNLVPASPKDVTVMQRRLIRAGYRNPNALKVLYGAKAIFARFAAAGGDGLAVYNSSAQQSNKIVRDSGGGGGRILRPQRIRAHGRQAPPETDPARTGQCARLDGGVRRVRTGARSGHYAGLQGTGARASGDQRGIGDCKPGVEGRQTARRRRCATWPSGRRWRT